MITTINEFKNFITGGLADNSSLKDIANKHNIPLNELQLELQKGIQIELEHTNDISIAREIAKDHLMEMPDYYTKLKTIEENAN